MVDTLSDTCRVVARIPDLSILHVGSDKVGYDSSGRRSGSEVEHEIVVRTAIPKYGELLRVSGAPLRSMPLSTGL